MVHSQCIGATGGHGPSEVLFFIGSNHRFSTATVPGLGKRRDRIATRQDAGVHQRSNQKNEGAGVTPHISDTFTLSDFSSLPQG